MNDDTVETARTERSRDRTDDDEVSIGEIFDVLSDHRRRYVLYVLSEEEEGAMDVEALAERLAPWIHETADDEVTEEQFRRTYTGLRHSQLPRLDDAGAVEYDQHRDRVSLGRTEPFDDYLSFAADRER